MYRLTTFFNSFFHLTWLGKKLSLPDSRDSCCSAFIMLSQKLTVVASGSRRNPPSLQLPITHSPNITRMTSVLIFHSTTEDQ